MQTTITAGKGFSGNPYNPRGHEGYNIATSNISITGYPGESIPVLGNAWVDCIGARFENNVRIAVLLQKSYAISYVVNARAETVEAAKALLERAVAFIRETYDAMLGLSFPDAADVALGSLPFLNFD